MIVVVTAEAESDLEQIANYIAEQSPEIALNFVQELREKCESLADAPRGYPLVPRNEHLGIRRRPFGNYLIFYRVGLDAIEVVHILHGARDYEPLLFSGKMRARLAAWPRPPRPVFKQNGSDPSLPASQRNHGLGRSGAQERTRTFTAVKPLAPEASASTNSATWARAG